MFNTSSAMGVQFAEAAREVTERIRKMGPNPIGNSSPPRGKIGDAALSFQGKA